MKDESVQSWFHKRFIWTASYAIDTEARNLLFEYRSKELPSTSTCLCRRCLPSCDYRKWKGRPSTIAGPLYPIKILSIDFLYFHRFQ